MLNESPRLINSAEGPDDTAHWSYISVPPPPATPAITSLENLATSLKSHSTAPEPVSYRQHTLQALADLTGYLTTQTYSLASSRLRIPGVQPDLQSTQEEDVRKEIRALKGLVLNRYAMVSPLLPSFMKTDELSSQEILSSVSTCLNGYMTE